MLGRDPRKAVGVIWSVNSSTEHLLITLSAFSLRVPLRTCVAKDRPDYIERVKGELRRAGIATSSLTAQLPNKRCSWRALVVGVMDR